MFLCHFLVSSWLPLFAVYLSQVSDLFHVSFQEDPSELDILMGKKYSVNLENLKGELNTLDTQNIQYTKMVAKRKKVQEGDLLYITTKKSYSKLQNAR